MKFKRRRKVNKQILLTQLFLVLLLFITIGYSVLNTNLGINGTIQFGKYIPTTATFDTGTNFAVKIKTLAGDEIEIANPEKTNNSSIQSFKKASQLPANFTATSTNTISTSDSEKPIYAWYDSNTLYYYSEADKVYLNSDSSWMFNRLHNITDISGLDGVLTTNLVAADRMFQSCNELEDISPLTNWDTSKVTNMKFMFGDGGGTQIMKLSDISPLANWDTSKVEDMFALFKNCVYLEDITPLANWDTSNVKNMSQVFQIHPDVNMIGKLKDLIPLKKWNTSNVKEISHMFMRTSIENVEGLEDWNTSNVTTVKALFSTCPSLANIEKLENWNTSNVTNMESAFKDCSSLTNINGLSNWNTSNVTHMNSMFQNCAALTNISVLSNWNTSKLTNMSSLFYGCSKATGTFTIKGNPTTYNTAFSNVATTPGSGVTVNYSRNTTNIDNIIATKSSDSNVVKGSIID